MDCYQRFSYLLIQLKTVAAISLCLLPLDAHSQNLPDYHQAHLTQCGNTYANQQSPQPLSNKQVALYYLCMNGFAIGYSPLSKTALWSAEHLTRARIEKASELPRVDNFHEESQLPDRIKAFLLDYKGVPYDRGHLAPNADMSTLESQYDSFSLANIIPQNPKNNRSVWRDIESRTRYLAIKHQSIYVVTGVAFIADRIKKINNNVLVPSHLYKAIYIPSLKQAGVYFVPNDDSQRVEIISLEELALRIGVDTMPGVATEIQKTAMPLPMNDYTAGSHPQKSPPIQQDTQQLLSLLINLLLMIVEWISGLFRN